ncbi:MAG TPA: tyrosine-type recombinase/integrase [Phycisphaerales bacterium]|nr:tyrosine-type recombinase/integrase [Phycisphaerales bacterium]
MSYTNEGRPAHRPKPKRRLPPEVLTNEEVLRLLAACPPTAPGLRNRALIAVLYRAGLRVAEGVALYPKDVDLQAGTIRVLHGKCDLARTVGIDPGGLAVLSEWLKARAEEGFGPAHPLFCVRGGRALSTNYVRRMLPQLAARAGVHKRVHAHGLRHTHAAQLRAEGVDIGIISKQLGHRSITTTATYLDHIAPLAVVRVVAARTWSN